MPRMELTIRIPDVREEVIEGRKIGKRGITRAVREAVCKAKHRGFPLFLSTTRKEITVK